MRVNDEFKAMHCEYLSRCESHGTQVSKRYRRYDEPDTEPELQLSPVATLLGRSSANACRHELPFACGDGLNIANNNSRRICA